MGSCSLSTPTPWQSTPALDILLQLRVSVLLCGGKSILCSLGAGRKLAQVIGEIPPSSSTVHVELADV
ncbi:hypothetical protein J2X01_003992 [Arthrobacter ginsengisoli]|uniref:Uncharacterized protein n=1 Tax=Arthrobacter ginsengisoli TaxID=1356565 RepID=A0ABU1UHK7_9MICC|nr:hypothetical protein [Arthrobacter ginsengisoli]MDR7084676.1 hypothetical protein [Arthrobacter ginsengisoli]